MTNPESIDWHKLALEAYDEIERLKATLRVARDRLIGSGSALSALEEGLGFVELPVEPRAQYLPQTNPAGFEVMPPPHCPTCCCGEYVPVPDSAQKSSEEQRKFAIGEPVHFRYRWSGLREHENHGWVVAGYNLPAKSYMLSHPSGGITNADQSEICSDMRT